MNYKLLTYSRGFGISYFLIRHLKYSFICISVFYSFHSIPRYRICVLNLVKRHKNVSRFKIDTIAILVLSQGLLSTEHGHRGDKTFMC